MNTRAALVVTLLVTFAACNGAVRRPNGDADVDSSPDGDADADEESDGDSGFAFESYGEFTLLESGDRQIYDDAMLMLRARRALELDARCGYDYYDTFYDMVPLGECRVLAIFDEFLDDCYATSCQYCVPTDDCAGWSCAENDPAVLLDAGEVVITGGMEPCTCTFQPGTLRYSCCSAESVPTFFEPGQVLEVSAPGGTFPGFELTLDVLPRPEITSEWTIDSFDGSQDVHVMWVPSGWDCLIDIVVSSSSLTPRFFRCMTDDDGELVIPASTIAEIAGPTASVVSVDLTRINEVTIQPTADSVLTARSMSSARVDVVR